MSRMPSGPQGQVGANSPPTLRFLSIHSHWHPILFFSTRFHATRAPNLFALRNVGVREDKMGTEVLGRSVWMWVMKIEQFFLMA